jgi:thiol-disulfide isomerase/thioredoxin
MNKFVRFAVLISLFVVSLATIPATRAARLPEDRWLYGAAGYSRALELQRELNVPLVVYFYADWCPYCHTLDNQYLPAAPVQQYLQGVVKVRINPEHGRPEREIANQYGVTGYPSFFVMRDATSTRRSVNPFRRGGSNLSPAEFVSACQRVASVSLPTTNSNGMNRSLPGRTNITARATGGATRKAKGGHFIEVPPASVGGSPNFITNGPLLTLDAVLTKYVEAIGGRDAQRRIRSRVTKAMVDVPGVSFGGKLEVYAKAPNKSLTTINVEPLGVLKQGFDGQAGWNLSDKGSQTLNATELTALAGADFYREIDLRASYSRIKLLGKVKEGYRELYMVEAVSRNGTAENLYFDAESGLLIHRDVTRRTAQGPVRSEAYFSDWREVDGVKLPFRMTQSMPNIRFVITLEDIKHNVPVEDVVFQRP